PFFSLPFTDFCYSLGSSGHVLTEAAMVEGKKRGWKYFERRNGNDGGPAVAPSLSFWGHEVDLTAGAAQMWEKMESGGRRAVRKAEKAGLKVEFATGVEAMEAYFDL